MKPESNLWSEYDIEATTSLTDRALRNLKFGDAFAVMDSHGDFGTAENTAEGLFFRDTRYLSRFELRLEGKRPLLLSSRLRDDRPVLSVNLTNPDLDFPESKLLHDTIFIQRTKFLLHNVAYERINFKSYAKGHHRLRIDFLFDADFRDIFEIRGTRRQTRGVITPQAETSQSTEFLYEGLDGRQRRTTLAFNPTPSVLTTSRATIQIELDERQQTSVFVYIDYEESATSLPTRVGYLSAYRELRRIRRKLTTDIATITTSSEAVNEVFCRATSDAYTLTTDTPHGPYPYAGIPWFNTVFGRDGIITAILMLWVDQTLAKGVLSTLALSQASNTDVTADCQPGKILHEMRHGEMATLKEVPFARYYGSIDATPLFVVLAGLYLDRTGDVFTIGKLWPNIQAALSWIEEYGDLDKDGFVEYQRGHSSGLANQGWKDSYDAIFHRDGSLAQGPIALCEIQGYVFLAKKCAANIADCLGLPDEGIALRAQAKQLQQRFEDAFWINDIGTYALALDGDKRPCEVVSSNAGQALFSGIASSERASRVATKLLSTNSFSGWGIRTVALDEARFNPMSYHNGSVWPHDNALIAMGMRRYGLKDAACQVFASILEAAAHHDSRLPELFCGFVRRPNGEPTPYPVACSPQAWSAGSVFGLLQASLGLELNHRDNEISLRDPVLPRSLQELTIRNLKLGNTSLDLLLHRHGGDVTANVLKRSGACAVSIVK